MTSRGDDPLGIPDSHSIAGPVESTTADSPAGSADANRSSPPPTAAGRSTGDEDRCRLGVLLLALLAAVTCLMGLDAGPRMGDHDCINALAARYTLQSGDWLIPHLGDAPRIRKTPLGIWLIAGSSLLVDDPASPVPVTTYAARLPSALAAWGTVMLVYWLGRRMYDRRTGLVCGFVAAACAGVIFYARTAQVDMVLTFLTTLAFALFWRGAMHPSPSRVSMIGFYVACALAMMAKAPLPVVTVGMALVVYWWVAVPVFGPHGVAQSTVGTVRVPWTARVSGQIRRVRTLWLIPGAVVVLLLAGAWPLYAYLHVDHAVVLWRNEYLDRFTGAMSHRTRPVLYYVPILLALTAPYMLSLPEAVVSVFLPRYRDRRSGLAFAWTWLMVGLCFLSASAFKRPHYVLSLLPAACLLIGPVVERLFFEDRHVASRIVRLTCAVIAVALAAAAITGGVLLHRSFPGLLRSYIPAGAGALVLWVLACRSFSRNRRMLSFAQLNGGVVVLMLWIWPGLGRGLNVDAQGDALAKQLAAHHVRTGDLIYQVDDRPDASVEFYHGYRIRRLISELEMTAVRSDRTSSPVAMYAMFAGRIRDALKQPKPVYLILKSGNLDMLQQSTDLQFDVLFKLAGLRKKPADELAVITQPQDTG